MRWLSHTACRYHTYTANVEPSKPRGSDRSAGMWLAISGSRRSPKSKLGEKSRHQAFRKMLRSNSTIKGLPQQAAKKSNRAPDLKIISSENACGTNRRPSLSSAPPLSAVWHRVDRARGRRQHYYLHQHFPLTLHSTANASSLAPCPAASVETPAAGRGWTG